MGSINGITVVVGTESGQHTIIFDRADIEAVERIFISHKEIGIEVLIAELMKAWRKRNGITL